MDISHKLEMMHLGLWSSYA